MAAMSRMRDRLSYKRVQNEKRPGYHPDGGGLYLQVSPTHTKSWIFRYTLHGRPREMGLGPYRDINLAEARRRAGEYRTFLHDKVDPIEARDAHRAQERLAKANTISFRECAENYVAAHRSGWKSAKHADQWTSTLETYCGKAIGNLPVSAIDTGLVVKVLEPIWTKKPETATRLRSRIEHVLDWSTVRGYRVGDNPARWRGHLQKLLPTLKKSARVKHHPALPYQEVGKFVAKLRGLNSTAARALEFTILTATRTAEVIGARSEEFDLKKAVWTIPARRMKAGRVHRVPLSPRAVAIVRAQPKGNFVFQGLKNGKPLSNMAMLALLARLQRDDITVHGFRSTFRDWASEQTNFPNTVCEAALAHAISDKTEAAYNRTDLFDKRRELMTKWSRYCTR